MKHRLFFIDQIRAFAIFLIIFEHNDHNSIFSEFSTSFSIPLFFILSAIVSKDKEDIPLLFFLKKQFTRLIVPYFSLSILLYLFWFILGRNYGESATQMYSPLKNFIGIFYAQGGPEYMNWGIPMWFLPALFITSIIDFIISKCPVLFRYILTFMITFAGFFLNKYLEYHLPWSIDIAFALYGFYFIGVVLRKLNFIDFLSNKWLSVLFTIVFCLIHLISFHNNGRILYYYGNYGYFPFMYLNGIAGFMWIFSLFSLIPKSKIIVWVGQNTLPILAFHLLAMTLIKGVFYFILNVQIQFDVILSLVYGILQITILVPFILLLNQHFPFLVGNKKKKHFDLNHDKD